VRALAKALPLELLSNWRAAAISLAVIGALFASICARQDLDDPDVWWLAATGERILRIGAVPRTNGFAFTDPEHPWVMHEWLTSLLYALGARAGGDRFFLSIGMFGGAITYFLVVRHALSHARHFAVGAFVALVALVAVSHASFETRPSMLWLSLPVAMLGISFPSVESARFGPARAAAGIGLIVLWTQLHGSFPLGLGLLAAGALERSGRDRTNQLLATAFSGAATLLNPYGWGLHLLALRYARAGSGDYVLQTVIEFRPLWEAWGQWGAPQNYAGLLLVVALSLSAIIRRRHLIRAILALILCAQSLLAARHIVLVSLVGPLLLLPQVEDWVAGARRLPTPRARMLPTALLSAIVPAAVGLLLIWSRPSALEHDQDLGGKAIRPLVRALPDDARVFSELSPSSVIIGRASQRGVRVFWDTRNDCYSLDTWRAARTLVGRRATSATRIELLESRRATHVILPARHPTLLALAETKHWVRSRAVDDWELWSAR
jgi:hypothetical protein